MLAMKYQGYEEIEDLRQQAYIGLCNAVDGYNPDEGVPFINYAGFWIRQCMRRYIEDCGSVVRFPVHIRAKIGKYKKVTAAFAAQFGRNPTDRETCSYLQISYEKLQRLKQAALMGDIGSLDVPVGEGEEGCLYDMLPGQESAEEEVTERLQREQLRDTLWSMVDDLPGQQPAVIRMRYKENMTLKDTGEKIGCTVNEARAIQSKALKALRMPRRSRTLQDLLYGDTYSKALKGNGVENFNRTWTSSTERAALIIAEVEEEINRELEKMRRAAGVK